MLSSKALGTNELNDILVSIYGIPKNETKSGCDLKCDYNNDALKSNSIGPTGVKRTPRNFLNSATSLMSHSKPKKKMKNKGEG